MSGRTGGRGRGRLDRGQVGGECVDSKIAAIGSIFRLFVNPGGGLVEDTVIEGESRQTLALRTSSANLAATALGFFTSSSCNPLTSLPVPDEESNSSSSSFSSASLSLSLSEGLALLLTLDLDSDVCPWPRRGLVDFLLAACLGTLAESGTSSSSDELRGMSGGAYLTDAGFDFGFSEAVASVNLGTRNRWSCNGRSLTYA